MYENKSKISFMGRLKEGENVFFSLGNEKIRTFRYIL